MICDECGGLIMEEKAVERAECWFCSNACGDEYFRTPEEIEINRLRVECWRLQAACEDRGQEIVELQTLLSNALEALKPFAYTGGRYEIPDPTKISLVVRAGDIRRAREVLACLTSISGDEKTKTADEQHTAEM